MFTTKCIVCGSPDHATGVCSLSTIMFSKPQNMTIFDSVNNLNDIGVIKLRDTNAELRDAHGTIQIQDSEMSNLRTQVKNVHTTNAKLETQLTKERHSHGNTKIQLEIKDYVIENLLNMINKKILSK